MNKTEAKQIIYDYNNILLNKFAEKYGREYCFSKKAEGLYKEACEEVKQ